MARHMISISTNLGNLISFTCAPALVPQALVVSFRACSWTKSNPDYWRKYRKSNSGPGGKTVPSSRQSALNVPSPVKMDDLVWLKNIPAGIYRIRPVCTENSQVKCGSWVVEITPVCINCPCQDDDCQDRT